MRSRLLALLLFAAGAFVVAAPDATSQPKDKEKPKEKEKGKPNKLAKESSPYLLQHAHNPVDWYPWGPEAFEKAKKEKKLIFLSHRLQRVPLVPRHGARVVLQRGDREACSTTASSASRWTARSARTSTTST